MSVLRLVHPDMAPIAPAPGGRATPCSLSYRKVGTRFVLSVSVSKQIAREIGFEVDDRKAANYAEIGFDIRSGTLVVVNVNDPDLPSSDSIRWKARASNGTLVFNLRAEWMPDDYATSHPATRCDYTLGSHEISVGSGKGGRTVRYIEITAPSWAAPGRAQAAVKTRLLDATPHVRPGPGRSL